MNLNTSRKNLMGASLIILVIIIGYYLFAQKIFFVPQVSPSPSVTNVEYKNNQYGFSVDLPESWRGYTVSIDKWIGNVSGGVNGDIVFIDGPLISIHNPKWTGANTYQDIPIMVFAISQWESLQQDRFHIGAAPIGPSELGRNAKYVFALPARYNYAFPPGYEEVDKIIQSGVLKVF